MIVRISGEFPDMEPVIEYFNSSFPNSILKEKHHNMLQYQLGSDVKLSAVFGQIEACRDKLRIEDYSVSQTTLDQVGCTGCLERNFLHNRYGKLLALYFDNFDVVCPQLRKSWKGILLLPDWPALPCI